MPDLVRNHVSLGKLARSAADVATAKARRDLIEERRVEIDLLVARTVERPHGALRFSAATRVRGAAIENEHRWTIESAVVGEDLFPLQVGAAEHLAYAAAHLVLRRRRSSRGSRRLHLRPVGTGQ